MPATQNLFQESLKLNPASNLEQPSLDLTIGCEFEFVFVTRHEGRKTTENDAKDMLISSLSREMEVVCQHCQEKQKKVSFNLPVKQSLGIDLTKWEVTFDGSVFCDEGDVKAIATDPDYAFWGMEIKSRILGQSAFHVKKCCGRDLTVAEEITAVLERLNTDFRCPNDSKEVKRFIYVNSKCGFHIHVGRAGSSFPISSVRKIMSLLVACEQQLDSLHALDRITGFVFDREDGLLKRTFPDHPVLDSNTYNLPLSIFFMADADRKRRRDRNRWGQDFVYNGYQQGDLKSSAVNTEKSGDNFSIWLARRSMDIDSWILRIRYTNAIEEIQRLHKEPFYNSKRCVFNVCNLRTDDGPHRIDTIEFRQHRGTLDKDTVLNYVNVLVRMVVFCHYMDDNSLYNLIGQKGDFRAPMFSMVDLCKAIGCGELTRKHYAERMSEKHVMKSIDVERKRIEQSFPKNDRLTALALHSVEDERRKSRPSKVKGRVRAKLAQGGYGRFRKNHFKKSLPDLDPNDLSAVIQRLRIDNVPPLNDGRGDPDDENSPGVEAAGYNNDAFSEDSYPRLQADRNELPGRIKQVLADKAAGEFNPMLPDIESWLYTLPAAKTTPVDRGRSGLRASTASSARQVEFSGRRGNSPRRHRKPKRQGS